MVSAPRAGEPRRKQRRPHPIPLGRWPGILPWDLWVQPRTSEQPSSLPRAEREGGSPQMPGVDRPRGCGQAGRGSWPWVQGGLVHSGPHSLGACRASLNDGRAAEGVCTQIPSPGASTNRTSSGDSGRSPCFQEHKGTRDEGRRLRNGKTPSAQEAELTTSGVQPRGTGLLSAGGQDHRMESHQRRGPRTGPVWKQRPCCQAAESTHTKLRRQGRRGEAQTRCRT